MRLAAILLLGVLGCSSAPPGPYFNDDKYLRFGVDTNEEANAVIESQKQRNLQLAQRLLGKHFTALGFMDKGGRSRAVRILTVRGVGVALDSRPETATEPPKSYALIAPPINDTHDADHDGFEEVFVEERTPKDSCLRVYRVRDVGFVDPVIVETQIFGREVCPRSAVDLDGDGVVELWSEVELGGFPIVGAALPRMALPLWADQHRFVARAGSRAQRAWLARERGQREAGLQHARKQLDVASCYVFAIELAALAYLEHGEPDAQLDAFDRALHGLVLTPAQATANLKARDQIFREWNNPERPPVPRAVAYQPPKDAQQPARRESRASKTARVEESALQRVLREGSRVRAQAPRPAPANLDEPVLAEGEFVITPQSAADHQAIRRGTRARSTTAVVPETDPITPPAAAELAAARATTRELGNAVVAERELAATARQAAATSRREAQAARARATQATDAAALAELRASVAEHVEAAQRYSADAAEHAAAAAKHREALLAQQALVRRMFTALAASGGANAHDAE